jgi:predicted permease
MPGWLVVLLKILAMFLVILAGWYARRRSLLSSETTRALSLFLVDLTIPALVFTQMLKTVDPVSLRASWYVPLLGGGVIVLGLLVGWATVALVRQAPQRNTYIFLVGVANWIYLPLPIVEALYGAEGIRALLLANVGAQLLLWSLCVWTLRGGRPDWASLRNVATNPGLIATAIGIAIALLVPAARTIETAPLAHASAGLLLSQALVQALVMVGSLTIPLSLIVTGAQLGELNVSDHRPSLVLTSVLVMRLIVTPLILLALGLLVWRLGVRLPEVARMVTYLIAAMPVAVSCSIFTQRFGGDTSLAARGIFYSTLWSIITVPAFIYLVMRLGV